MARLCGINMSESRLQKLNSRHHTFLTKRFDRTNKGKRIHFSSAMTMLGHVDGESHLDGISYLEMVEWIMANCENHLRNHGFMLNKQSVHRIKDFSSFRSTASARLSRL